MTEVKKVVKFAEEKSLNKLKKMRRAKERKTKYEEPDTVAHEQEPQPETPKEREESFAHYKRCCDPKDPLYQAPPELLKTRVNAWAPFTPLKLEDYTAVPEVDFETIRAEFDKEILQRREQMDDWESDGDDWFD